MQLLVTGDFSADFWSVGPTLVYCYAIKINSLDYCGLPSRYVHRYLLLGGATLIRILNFEHNGFLPLSSFSSLSATPGSIVWVTIFAKYLWPYKE